MIKKYLPSIIFNLGECLIIYLTGLILKLETQAIMVIVLSFVVARMAIGEPKHYKAWQLCLLWTTIIFLTLFLVGKVDIIIGSLIATFNALIISGRADIKDTFLWQSSIDVFLWKPTRYQKELDFVKYNLLSDVLIEFESKLEKDDNLTYLVYKYIFKDGESWQSTAENLDISTNKLTPIVDKIAFSIRIFCKI